MNEQSNKNKRNSLVITILLIIFLFISVSAVTYAAFVYGKKGVTKNTINTGTLTFTYTESTNGISLTNAMPMLDDIGKKLDREENNSGYFDFNINYNTSNERSVDYEIYATPINVDNQLSPEYVKVYLTNADTDTPISGYQNEIPVFSELKDSSIDPNSKRLYYGSFNKSQSVNYRLRIWLSNEYEVDSISKMFKIKVNVSASDE